MIPPPFKCLRFGKKFPIGPERKKTEGPWDSCHMGPPGPAGGGIRTSKGTGPQGWVGVFRGFFGFFFLKKIEKKLEERAAPGKKGKRGKPPKQMFAPSPANVPPPRKKKSEIRPKANPKKSLEFKSEKSLFFVAQCNRVRRPHFLGD